MRNKKIIYQNAVTVNQEQWFWSENYNALYKRKLNNGAIHRMSPYERSKTAAYTKLVFYKNKLIALPYAANQIMIYDIQNEEIRYSDIGIQNMNYDDNVEKFYGIAVKDNWLFMIGCKTAHVLKFDMEAELAADYVDLHTELMPKENGIGYLRDGIVLEEKIIIPGLYENSIFEINITDLEYEKIHIDKNGLGFSTIFKAQDEVWLFPFDEGEILQWNRQKNTIRRHCIEHLMALKKGARNFLSAQQCRDKLWIIPRYGSRILSYDFIENQFSNQNAVNRYFDSINKEVFGIADEKIGQDIIFLAEQIDELIVFCAEKDEVRVVNNDMQGADHLEFLKNEEKKLVVFEHEMLLSDYLDFLCRI